MVAGVTLHYHNLDLRKYNLKQLCDSTYGEKRVVTYPLCHTEILKSEDYHIRSWITRASISIRILLDKVLKQLAFLNSMSIVDQSQQQHALDALSSLYTGYQEDIDVLADICELHLYVQIAVGQYKSRIETIYMKKIHDRIIFHTVKDNNWLVQSLVETYYNMLFAYHACELHIKLPMLVINHMELHTWQDMDHMIHT